LREGLDIPEVELVAIFDADKEGFLRSDRSLIQTIGRAARNIKGRCILYGDDVTGSMRRAIDETSRRRELQIAYNDENNIKPKGIIKDIREALDDNTYIDNDSLDKLQIVSNSKKKFTKVNSNNVTSIIIELEKEMYNHANNLEFEDAAKLRDQINELQEKYLMLPKAKS
ncbi:MAG: UvrB/UvrC motif-containing protein, partial [Gammaproteobacteria bacterium]